MDSSFILETLKLYQMPALFLGSFLLGESVILAASFLAAQGLWSLATVWWLAFLGTLASDALWFLYGQKLLSYFHRWDTYRHYSDKFLQTLERATGTRPYRVLLLVKAVYGMRILTIIYLSIRKVGFGKFIIFDAIGSAWWLSLIVTFGWLAGKSFGDFLPALEKLEYVLLAIVCIIIVWRLIFSWIGKKAVKEL